MMNSDNIRELQKLIQEDRVIPFIGAGISLEAEFNDGTYPPSDKQLLENLYNNAISNGADFKKNEFHNLYFEDRSSLTNAIKNYWGNDLGYQIRSALTYTTVKPSQHQRILGLLRFKMLITTNYDTILEDTIYPRPERLVLYNNISLNHVIKEFDSYQSKRPVLIKLNGCQTQPESIALGSGISYYEKYWKKPFIELFEWNRDISLLFIGYSLNDNDFINFLNILKKTNKNIKFNNFCIVSYKEYQILKDKPFIKELNIKLLFFKIPKEEDYTANSGYNGLWQILSQLRTNDSLDLTSNIQSGVFFNKDERGKYLYFQELMEQKATCLRYFTPAPTNAISPSNYIQKHCTTTLTKLYESSNFQSIGVNVDKDTWVDEVIEIMLLRSDTIMKKMKQGAEVRVLCFKKQIKEDSKSENELIKNKYKYILEKIDDDRFDLELRMISHRKVKPDQHSYALISSPNETNTDISMAYAAQASKGDSLLHVIERNTNFVKNNLVEFESYWARAVDENTTREYIRKLFY
jgi:hypothetical protein